MDPRDGEGGNLKNRNTFKIQAHSNATNNLLRKEIIDMKNIRIGISAFLFAILMGAVTAMPGWTAQGPGDGTCSAVNIFDGVQVTIDGTVASIGYSGQGMKIDIETDIVTVYGIGSIRFWDNIGIARPEVGEFLAIEGYEVTFSDGNTKIIAYSVTIGDETVILRDEETGAPVWRGAGQGRGAGHRGGCRLLQ